MLFLRKIRVFWGVGGVVSECASQAEVNKHLELGRDFLARGQLSDALTHYHAAVGECTPGHRAAAPRPWPCDGAPDARWRPLALLWELTRLVFVYISHPFLIVIIPVPMNFYNLSVCLHVIYYLFPQRVTQTTTSHTSNEALYTMPSAKQGLPYKTLQR